MARYLVSFDDGWMTLPEEDLPEVAKASHEVVQEETKAVIGGFSILDVASRDEAMEWAAKIAAACRCSQEVRELMYDPGVLSGAVLPPGIGTYTCVLGLETQV